MGIKNLTSFIKTHSPDSMKNSNLYSYEGKTLAIDASIFLYKSLINVRSKNDYLRNKEGKIISHIQGIYIKTVQYLTLGIKPIYIFDGKPPSEKKECINGRKKKVEELKKKMENSNSEKEKKELEKGTIRLTKEYIDDIKKLLNLMGVSYIHANGEAEAYASEMCRLKMVDGVVTEDMDTLTYGCPVLIRKCIDKSIKRPDMITTFNYEKIIEDLKLTHEQFIDFCILCGCDYCPTILRVGPQKAYQYIQKYGTIEKIIESCSNLSITEDFKNKYVPSRGIFKMYYDKLRKEDLKMNDSKYDSKKLYDYLINDCSFSEKRVKDNNSKIDNYYNKYL